MTHRVLLGGLGCLLALTACTSDPASPDLPDPSDPPAAGGDVDRVPGQVIDADSIAVSPDGASIAAGCADELCLWSTADGTVTATYDGGNVVAWGPDLIATSGLDGDRATIDLLSPDDGTVVRTIDGHEVEDAQDAVGVGITALEFSPDGTLLASAGHDGTVRLWSVEDGSPVVTITVQDPRSLAFDPDGGELTVGTPGGSAQVFQVPSGVRTETLVPGGGGVAPYRFARSVDGTLAYTVAGDDAVHVGRTELTGHEDQPRAVAWAPGGRTLYSASPSELFAWDPESGELIREFEVP